MRFSRALSSMSLIQLGQSARVFGRRLVAGASMACAAAAVSAPDAKARGLVRDAEIERTLRMISKPIYDAAGLSFDRSPIFMINSRSLNAFVTAGNIMFIHTGMLLELETPEEIMAVIAHEAGHIVEKHVITRIAAQGNARTTAIVSSLIGLGVALAGGGDAGIATASAGQSVALRDLLRFTRAQEGGADQTGVRLMTEAGVDPRAMLLVLQRFANQTAGLSIDPYAQTHPLGRQRMIMLEAAVEKSSARGKSAPKEFDYWVARMRAKLEGFLATPGSVRRRFDDPEIDLYREAIYLHRLPDPEGAIRAIDQLIAMRPQDPFYWELKGQILFESGRGPEAIDPYRRATQLAPNEPLIAAGLGEALLTAETSAANKEALRVLEQAVIADPYSVGMRRSLAIAYARAGNDGMAAVVTAERMALLGRIDDAHLQAQRAKALLPVGSPGWLRADDVLALKPRR